MTLSQASAQTKLILKWLGIILGGLILILIVFRIIGALKDTFFPSPEPPPQVLFGKLPQPDFPASDSRGYTYTVDTISGSLPIFPSQVKVYKMEEKQPDLLALSKAKSLIGNVGFANDPAKISENIYQWTDSKGRTLTMNISDLNFNMISPFLTKTDQPVFSHDLETAKNTALIFLQSIGLLEPDLDGSKTQTGIYSIKNYSIIPSTSLSNTQAVQVSMFQNDINKLPVFYPRFSISPMNFLVGDVNGESQVVEANFFYQKPIDTSSTYPVKTIRQAFDDLKNGKTFISSPSSQLNIPIKNVLLGYYIPERKQPFLLPIFVFEADNGFVAYVNAVKDEWTNK